MMKLFLFLLCYRRPTSSSLVRRTPAAATTIITTVSAISSAQTEAIPRSTVMEEENEKKVYVHYNHTDPYKHLRWTARESYQFMHQRPWGKVIDFYSDLVRGHYSLPDLFGIAKLQTYDVVDKSGNVHKFADSREELTYKRGRTGRWERVTFKIVISYHGSSFDGWQKQPGLDTVQGLVERSLGGFVDEQKSQKLKDKMLPVEPCSMVAGRTDKGVSALGQVCAFYTWRNDVHTRDVEEAVSSAAPGKLRALLVSKVSRTFHPNFSAKWRRYFYIFPLNDSEEGLVRLNEQTCFLDTASLDKEPTKETSDSLEEPNNGWTDFDDETSKPLSCQMDDIGMKPICFSISKVDKLIRQLERKSLSYKMFARDTKASRSIGPATDCYMFHARAAEARLPCADKADACGQRVMCVELVANRFLRKMVRVLVATAIREAAAGADDEALLRLMDATCRRATAPPAPPEGLCLAEVGYEEFVQDNCLIV